MNWFGFHIAFGEVIHDPVFKLMDVGEVTRGQHLALQRGEDDLHPIRPGGVDWQPVDPYLEGKLQRPNPIPDLLRGMGGSVIEDQVQDSNPLCPEAPEDHPEEVLELHEPFARETACHRLAAVNQQPGKQMQHSFANVAGSMTHRLTGLSGINPAGSSPGLHAGLLIGADEDLSPSSQGVRLLVEIQYDRGLLEELRIGRLLPGVTLPGLDLVCSQPVTDRRGGNA